MMKWMLAVSAAALAISSPVQADRGGYGGGKGQGGGQAGQAEQRGVGHVARGGGERQVQVQRGGGNREFRAMRMDRGGGNREFRAARIDRSGEKTHARPMRFVQGEDRGRGNDNMRIENRGGEQARTVRFENQGRVRGKERIIEANRGREMVREHGNENRVVDLSGDRIFRVRDADRGVVRFRDVDRDELFGRKLGYGVGGCPPGLAKKGNGCMPPGQAAKFIGQPLASAARLAALEPLPLSMRSLYWDNDDYYYRYGGGYLYRVDRDRDLIDGLLPLFGAALIGQPLNPYYVNSYYRPSYYSAFYPSSPYDCYQYGYGYVYDTNCATGLVEDVIPTYDYGYGIGQIMPASYSYYNVPYAYRSYYTDDDDYYYRYAPGAIYRVDRDTALISAVVALLTGGLSVGQPLPLGYSAYNVPLAYRSTYYDTPDVWYRYDNGYIYAVDPGTRVVRSVAYTIV